MVDQKLKRTNEARNVASQETVVIGRFTVGINLSAGEVYWQAGSRRTGTTTRY